jgi:3-hydroxyacyl-[acyl-carrier-protein] dehydratase
MGGLSLDIIQIMNTNPHRYPFLLVDRILELEPGKRAVGLKCVTMNEPFFQGHFPGNPIMPGVLIVEHAAQIGSLLMMSLPENQGKLGLFAGIDEVKFRRKVVPGDQLITEVIVTNLRKSFGKCEIISKVGDEIAMSGIASFMLVPDPTYKKEEKEG